MFATSKFLLQGVDYLPNALHIGLFLCSKHTAIYGVLTPCQRLMPWQAPCIRTLTTGRGAPFFFLVPHVKNFIQL